MSCEVTRQLLGAFCDGELPGLDNWRVRRHLARCAECGREAESLRKLDTLLRAADVAPREVMKESAAPRVSPGWLLRLPRAGLASGLALLSLFALLFFFRSSSSSDPLENA